MFLMSHVMGQNSLSKDEQNSLAPYGNKNLNLLCSLKQWKIHMAASVKQIICPQFFIFELGGTCITKQSMNGLIGNSDVCYPLTLNVPLRYLQKHGGSQGTKLIVLLGSVTEC